MSLASNRRCSPRLGRPKRGAAHRGEPGARGGDRHQGRVRPARSLHDPDHAGPLPARTAAGTPGRGREGGRAPARSQACERHEKRRVMTICVRFASVARRNDRHHPGTDRHADRVSAGRMAYRVEPVSGIEPLTCRLHGARPAGPPDTACSQRRCRDDARPCAPMRPDSSPAGPPDNHPARA